MSIFSSIGNAFSGAGDALFGTGKKPGFLGTGQQTFNPYKIDPNAAKSQNGQALQQQGQQRLNQIDQRQAPTVANQQIASNERIGNTTIAPTVQANAAQLGPANTMQGAAIQRDDMQARGMQNDLNDQLAAQSRGEGPSLASMQLQDAQDRNAKQAMGLAASMPGQGNSALAARNAMNAVSNANQDAARAAAEARIQEQNNARSALSNNLSTTRGQDIGVNTSQAGFNQEAAAQNMGAQNQFQLQNAQNVQQINLANAQAENARAGQQAELEASVNAGNAGATNAYNLNQAQMNQQGNIANQNAYLQNQSQNDNASGSYYGALVGQDQADRNAAMQLQGMKANQDMGVMGLQQNAYQSAGKAQSNLMGGAMSAGGSALAMLSDENMKTNLVPLSNSAYDMFPTEETSSKPAKKASDPMADAMGKMGKGGDSKGGSPMGLAAGAAAGAGNTGMMMFNSSALGQMLHKGDSPTADWGSNPAGDMKLNGSGGLDPAASMAAINKSTVQDPTTHPGATPMGGGGMMLGPLRLSDKNQKDQVNVIDVDVSSDLKKAPPYQYEYKNPNMPGASAGKQIGPMAQDLEKTKLFGHAVHEDANGTKYLDQNQMLGGMLAGMAMLNRKVDALDKKKKA